MVNDLIASIDESHVRESRVARGIYEKENNNCCVAKY